MLFILFSADAQQRDLRLPLGFSYPGNDISQAWAYAVQSGFRVLPGVNYSVKVEDLEGPPHVIFFGNSHISKQSVQDGMNNPAGQQGGTRPNSEVDPRSGFQVIGDENLPAGGDDSMFGNSSDTMGTYTDIYRDGPGGREVPRNIPR